MHQELLVLTHHLSEHLYLYPTIRLPKVLQFSYLLQITLEAPTISSEIRWEADCWPEDARSGNHSCSLVGIGKSPIHIDTVDAVSIMDLHVHIQARRDTGY